MYFERFNIAKPYKYIFTKQIIINPYLKEKENGNHHLAAAQFAGRKYKTFLFGHAFLCTAAFSPQLMQKFCRQN